MNNAKPDTLKDDYNCPKKAGATLDSNGHCSTNLPNIPDGSGCNAYCEVKLTPIFGQEVPFMDGACQSSTSCTISTGQSITITNTYSVNVNVLGTSGEDVSKTLTSAFDVGASYSYSKSIGYTTTEVSNRVLNETTCGYWTFIPYLFKYVPTSELALFDSMY